MPSAHGERGQETNSASGAGRERLGADGLALDLARRLLPRLLAEALGSAIARANQVSDHALETQEVAA
jgi:hypothetical protein